MALLLRIQEVPGLNLGQKPVILSEDFRGFHQSPKENMGIAPAIGQPHLPYEYFPFHYTI
jgi:hypothetical protein